jgi:hypothetical protein
MQRKACVEFMGFTKVRVTTSFYQKEFDLEFMKKNDMALDLISLKLFKIGSGHKTPFRAEVWDGDGTISEPFHLTVLARISDDKWDEEIGSACVKDKTRTFCVTLPDKR